MIVERFADAREVYAAASARAGDRCPTGLRYVDSWVRGRTCGGCFQLMECDDAALLQEWVARAGPT